MRWSGQLGASAGILMKEGHDVTLDGMELAEAHAAALDGIRIGRADGDGVEDGDGYVRCCID